MPPLGAPSLLECHPEQATVGGLLGCWERAGPSPQLALSCAGAPSEVEMGQIDLKKTKQPLGPSVLIVSPTLSQGGVPGVGGI